MRPPASSTLPRHSSEIEWWYFHGMLDERQLLFVCFWRYRGRNGAPDGLTASYSLTAVDNARRAHATFVDDTFFAQIRETVAGIVRREADPYLEAFLDETVAGGLFAPYRRAEQSALEETAGGGLAIRVGPCALRCDAAGSRIYLEVRDTALTVALEIDGTGAGFAMGGGGSFMLAGKRMQGWTRPRLAASGTVAVGRATAEAVCGVMWFDHQWGQWSFARAHRHFYHPEWIYYAAVLDDGRSLVLYQRKSAGGGDDDEKGKGRARHFAYIALLERDGRVRSLGAASIVPRDTLESLRTNNAYEYGWGVEIPEIDARLEFAPLHANHEVFVFIKQRGILELGCRIEGQIGGRACRGWGFVEVFGDTVDINRFFWGQRKTNLARQLEKFLPRSSQPAWLQRVCASREPLAVDAAALNHAIFGPLWSMMDRGGKGWRSAWLTTCYYAFGRDDLGEAVRELLPIAELLHTGSLIIDDFQDGSDLRRGRPTTHREVGADLAINAGCFCYFLPLLIVEELQSLSETQRARIYAIVANAMRQGHLGQAMDLMWSKGRYDLAAKIADLEGTRAQLVEQYRLKSGCQLEAIARIAGVLAEAPPAQVEAVAAYSRAFGVAFQIIDDVVGIYEGRHKLGKDDGEDVRNGKLNMLLLHALAAVAPEERAAWFQRIFEPANPENGDGLRAARELAAATGARDHCLDEAEALMAAVSAELDQLPRTDARIVMRSVPRWLRQQQRNGAAKGGSGARRRAPPVKRG